MSYTIDQQRVLFGVTCNTASDIIYALQAARSQGQDVFFSTLKNAVDTADEDLICGHVDWFRIKLGEALMNAKQRDEVMSFYKSFISANPTPSDDRSATFMSDAYDKFV